MKKKWICVLLAGILMCSGGFAACSNKEPTANGDNVFTPSGNDTAAGSVTLKIASYNIKNCNNGEDIDKIAADITAQNLDLVAVQEVDRGSNRAGGRDVLKELAAKSLPNYHFFKTIKLPGGDYGIGILSRYPLENCKQENLKTVKKAEDRVLAQAEITVKGIKLHVFNTHLSFEDTGSRKEQIRFINEQLKTNEPFVLMGDFNVQGYEEFDGFTEGYAINNSTTQFMSYIGEDDGFRGLDNIIYSKNVKVEDVQMVKTSASDHNMLIGTFTVSKQ